ncbi:hypothetical protein BJ912DRAFT_166834 [Pholiota molesta]|nr:hypothetical protein BJ912DRAFT_166834 [Pholiota molesta]
MAEAPTPPPAAPNPGLGGLSSVSVALRGHRRRWRDMVGGCCWWGGAGSSPAHRRHELKVTYLACLFRARCRFVDLPSDLWLICYVGSTCTRCRHRGAPSRVRGYGGGYYAGQRGLDDARRSCWSGRAIKDTSRGAEHGASSRRRSGALRRALDSADGDGRRFSIAVVGEALCSIVHDGRRVETDKPR